MPAITFDTAKRTSAIPVIVFYGESGSGKTYSALLLARGIAGPRGKIKVIDTERGRASIYADDKTIGGYEVCKPLLEEPYSPARHIEYLDAAEQGADVVMLDSGSHEWEGPGGVLDMAEQKGGEGLAKWKEPKKQHAFFIGRLLRSRVPIIICLRAKYRTRFVLGTAEMAEAGIIQKNAVGKKTVVKDDALSPIQAEDFIFEATVHIQVNPDHTIVVTKGGTPELRECFPQNNKAPLSIQHGEAVGRWITGGGHSMIGPQKPATTPATGAVKPAADAKALRGQIWGVVKDVPNPDTWEKMFADGNALSKYLLDEGMIGDTEDLQTLPVERLTQILAALQQRFPRNGV